MWIVFEKKNRFRNEGRVQISVLDTFLGLDTHHYAGSEAATILDPYSAGSKHRKIFSRLSQITDWGSRAKKITGHPCCECCFKIKILDEKLNLIRVRIEVKYGRHRIQIRIRIEVRVLIRMKSSQDLKHFKI